MKISPKDNGVESITTDGKTAVQLTTPQRKYILTKVMVTGGCFFLPAIIPIAACEKAINPCGTGAIGGIPSTF